MEAFYKLRDLPLAAALFFAATVLASAFYVFPFARGVEGPWYGAVVTPEEVDAALWVDSHVARNSLFAADLFACEMLVSAGGQLCAVGGAWELADNPNQRFSDNEKAFLTNSSQEAHSLFRKYGVQYVFVHPRNGFYAYGWKPPSMAKFDDTQFFKLAYQGAGGTRIYSVN